MAAERRAAEPSLSSVDNGWLATGLRVVANRVPELSLARAGALRQRWTSASTTGRRQPDLFHYVPDTGVEAVLLRHDRLARAGSRATSGSPRARSRRRHYFGAYRVVPGHLRLELDGDPARRLHAHVLRRSTSTRARYPYNGTRVTPSWGGSMFEALMPALFVPEEQWAPGSWGANHPLTVEAQIHHGLARPATATGASRPPTSPRAATGVRRRRHRHATRTATRPTTTARSSTTAAPGCPGRPALAGPAAERLHQRRRDAARRVPRPCATRRARRSRTWPGSSATSGIYRPLGLPRLGQRPDRRGVGLLPLARPGHDHGRARQRARR